VRHVLCARHLRLLLPLILMTFCTQAPPAPPSGQTPRQAEATAGPRVVFPDGFVVRVEIAADDELRAQGLMYRDQLRPGTGMLFFFPEEGEYPFWMKNTMIPLDMIWIDANRRVAHVKFEVPPCRVADCPSYPPNARAKYVLEVAGGVAREHGLKAGDVLKFEQTEGIVAR
jgi:uncharacterized protein